MIGLIRKIFGTQNDRELKRMGKLVDQINDLEPEMEAKSDEELGQLTRDLKERLSAGAHLDDLLIEAFAAVREASRRTMGMRHFDVQMQGGIALHEGNIAEMRTGEGKTLVSTLASYLNALSGEGVHLVTVNDYLARRDAHWMGPIFSMLGVSVGIIQSSGALGPDNTSFLYDAEYQSQIPNFQHLKPCTRREAYAADITYGTNNEFGFDYLRDNMVFRREQRTQRGRNFAIVDEVDSILIDEARTPLVISGPAEDSSKLYQEINKIAPLLKEHEDTDDGQESEPGDFIVDEKMRSIDLTEEGHNRVEKILEERKLISPEQSLYSAQNLGLLHHVHTALKAHHLNKRDVEYIVQNGQVILIDQHTGRTMPGRRMGEGLHQAIEAKEGLEIHNESQTLASTTFQNFFRTYQKLSGMTGTADTEAVEFQQIYGLQVVAIPTNKPMIRKDLNDLIYLTQEEKYEAVVKDIKEYVAKGAPVLVGTISVESSEYVSAILKKEGIKHEVLNAKYHEKEAQIVANAGLPGAVTIATNMAGRGTDIVLGGNLDAEISAQKNPSDEQIEKIRKDWKVRHEKVLEAGGLHIIGTERHESRRIDNQLRGRAGRQGDPGLTRFYLSMEDSLMRLFASDRVRGMMQAIGMERGEAIEHRMVTNSIEKAQRKVEGRNFDIRKQLLEYDDVANDQRIVVYGQRNDLLESDDISGTIASMRAEVVQQVVSKHMPPGSIEDMWSLDDLEQELKVEFNLPPNGIKEWILSDKSVDSAAVEARVLADLEEAYTKKMANLPEETVRRLERDFMLQVLDRMWKDHLATMDYLRAGIGLRGYGGRNPKQEYKRESFELFSNMMEKVRYEGVRLLARVEIASPEDIEQMRKARAEQEKRAREAMSMKHAQASSLSGPEAQKSRVQKVETFIRDEEKVGRNDPCPCGSGKKYKHCHGALS
ncbi:MAG: preprotein translocase subunit SecA [Porticoccaceae bacterium]